MAEKLSGGGRRDTHFPMRPPPNSRVPLWTRTLAPNSVATNPNANPMTEYSAAHTYGTARTANLRRNMMGSKVRHEGQTNRAPVCLSARWKAWASRCRRQKVRVAHQHPRAVHLFPENG